MHKSRKLPSPGGQAVTQEAVQRHTLATSPDQSREVRSSESSVDANHGRSSRLEWIRRENFNGFANFECASATVLALTKDVISEFKHAIQYHCSKLNYNSAVCASIRAYSVAASVSFLPPRPNLGWKKFC